MVVIHFLYLDKHQSFYKLTLSFEGSKQTFPKYPKQEIGVICAIY